MSSLISLVGEIPKVYFRMYDALGTNGVEELHYGTGCFDFPLELLGFFHRKRFNPLEVPMFG